MTDQTKKKISTNTNRRRRILFGPAIALGLGAAACGAEVGDAEQGTGTAPIYADTTALWGSTAGTAATPLTVCFDNPTGWWGEIAWVRNALTSTWQAETGVTFDGFGQCGSASIHVHIDDSRPRVEDGLGIYMGKMHLNFTYNNWSPACQSTREFCIRANAIHEFGHALGLSHEANRPDSPCTDTDGHDGDTFFSYDADSVMNYCAPYRTDLSPLDKDGIKRLYGQLTVHPGHPYALSNQLGNYLTVAGDGNRTPRTIVLGGAIVNTQVVFPSRASGGGTDIRYDQGALLAVSGGYVGIVDGTPDLRLPSGTLTPTSSPKVAVVSSLFAWTVEKGNFGFGNSITTRKPFLLSAIFNNRKYYLMTFVDNSRMGGGLQKIAFTTDPTDVGAQWRLLGPIEKT